MSTLNKLFNGIELTEKNNKVRRSYWDKENYLELIFVDKQRVFFGVHSKCGTGASFRGGGFSIKMSPTACESPSDDMVYDDWEPFNPTKKITLYRYTYLQSADDCLKQSWWMNHSWDQFCTNARPRVLFETEKKEIEIETEEDL